MHSLTSWRWSDVPRTWRICRSKIVIFYRRIQKESDELLYTVRSLVTVRNQLPAQVVKIAANTAVSKTEHTKWNFIVERKKE